MNPRALKYLLDIESVIVEIETITQKLDNNFIRFKEDFIIQRAIERELEIIGEALNKLQKEEPTVKISNIPNIIALRNLIIHAYDSVDLELIWAIIQRDIPKLKHEVSLLK